MGEAPTGSAAQAAFFGSLFSLKGRTALVTGSSRGIGHAIALGLAQAGATVILHGTRDSAPLREAAAELSALTGTEPPVVTADLSDDAAVAALPGQLAALGLSPDILVLNASVQAYVHIEDCTPEEFAREFRANVGACFQLVQTLSPAMTARGWGRIVCVGSVNQLRPAPRLALYSATKAALANFTQCAAKVYAPSGVTVNNLVPGTILTDRNREVLKDEAFTQRVLSGIPAGRLGEPADLVGAALLLCSEAGSYITGTELVVSGGMHL